MKKWIVMGMVALFVVASNPALARGYGHGYRHSYGHGGGGWGHRGFNGYGHHRGYYGHRGGHAGYLVGGLVLGALLAPPRYVAPPTVIYAPSVPAPAPVSTPVVTPRQATVSRRLLRDINGNCFERKIDPQGTELRVELPASECAW